MHILNTSHTGQRPFVFTIQTTSSPQTFTLPLLSGYTYKFKVIWGDGTSNLITSDTDPNITHSYATAGIYTIRIIGQCPTFYFNNTGDKTLLKTIDSWGNGFWERLSFYGCSNLTSLPNDRGNFSRITTFKLCFAYCSSLTSIPSGLFDNCPNVTDFSECFYNDFSLTGNAPELWLRTNPTPDGTDCFYNCTGLTNYASIPLDWK